MSYAHWICGDATPLFAELEAFSKFAAKHGLCANTHGVARPLKTDPRGSSYFLRARDAFLFGAFAGRERPRIHSVAPFPLLVPAVDLGTVLRAQARHVLQPTTV